MELEARNMSYTTLTADITNSVTTIPVTNAAVFPSAKAFIITINNERILVDSVSSNDLIVNATGRGYDGSSVAAHSNGDTVSIKVVAGYINWVNDAVAGKYAVAGGDIEGNVAIVGDSALELGDLAVANDLAVTGDAAITGALAVTGETTLDELKSYKETLVTPTVGGSPIAIDVADGLTFKHTMDADTEFTFTAPGITGITVSFTLIVKMHSSAQDITWPASVTFDSDTAPDAPDPDKVGIYTFVTINNGTRWYGSVMANHMTE